MGLIRKSLYLGTGGLVSPNSKKQRRDMQMLTAMQGGTAEEIRRAGGRYDFRGFWGIIEPASVEKARRDQEASALPGSVDSGAAAIVRTGVVTEVREADRRHCALVVRDEAGEVREHEVVDLIVPYQYRASRETLVGRTVRIKFRARTGAAITLEVLDQK